jgi:hypothetical protein
MDEVNLFWDKLKYLLTSPKTLFQKVKDEGIEHALIMYAIAAAFVMVVSMGSSLFSHSDMDSSILFRVSSAAFAPFGFVAGIISTFVYSGIIHLVIIMFKGNGKYAGTYKAYTYSIIPFLIFSLVPIIGGLSIFYSAIIMVMGLSMLHNISIVKALISCLAPILILVVFLFVILLIVFSSNFRVI